MRVRTATIVGGLSLLAVLGTGCGASSGSTAQGSTGGASPSSSASATASPPAEVIPSASSSPSGGSTIRPSEPRLAAALSQQVPGLRVDLVKTPAGYEAAAYDQKGAISFWATPATSTSWHKVGSSGYPYFTAPADATATGALLTGMQHATFIVHGVFTGDSSGNAVAFTTGTHGWGVIKALPSGHLASSGTTVQSSNQVGLSLDLGFADGELVTKDCRPDVAIAECGQNPIVKHWRWSGSDFVRA